MWFTSIILTQYLCVQGTVLSSNIRNLRRIAESPPFKMLTMENGVVQYQTTKKDRI